LFVAHGANDPRVPVAEAERIVAAVRANGHDVWSMIATNEGHGLRKKDNRDTFSLLQVPFSERHLKPRPEPRRRRPELTADETEDRLAPKRSDAEDPRDPATSPHATPAP